MSDFVQAGIVRAGNSNPLPPRDYIVRAGSSIAENRDFIVVQKRNFFHLGGTIEISSSLLGINDFSTLSAETSSLSVVSSLAGLTLYTSLLLSGQSGVIQVASGGTRILRVVKHLPSAIQALSSPARLLYNRVLAPASLGLGVASSSAALTTFTATSMAAEGGAIEVKSGLLTIYDVDPLLALAIGVSSGQLRTAYSRVLQLAPLALGVASGQGALSPFSLVTLEAQASIVQVSSSDLSTDIRKYLSIQTCALAVASPPAAFLYDRILGLATHVLGVRSGTGTLLFNTLASSAVTVFSSETIFGYRYHVELEGGAVSVRSSNAVLSNPHLVGLAGVIGAVSSLADLRFLSTGYLPSTAPTNRSFQPPVYKIEKTTVFNGRTVRQVMCSKASEAVLTLEYLNVSDAFAEEVLSAYDQSFGTQYGFVLPPVVVAGAGLDLLNYISLNGSTLKWFYAGSPSVEAVSKGICNLNVQLKARVETK